MAETGAKTDWSNLSTRLGSALVIAAVAFVCLWFGGWVWATLIILGAARMMFEWKRLIAAKSAKEPSFFTLESAMVVAALVFFTLGWISWPGVLGACAGMLLFFIFGRERRPAQSWEGLGLAYIILPATAAIWTRDGGVGVEAEGFQLALFVIVSVIAADAGAYFAGKSIGGPKFAPRISPNKTWAGFGGGVVAGSVAGAVIAELFGHGFGLAAIVAAAVVVASVAGDLLESAFKRHFDVKDIGSFLPGHGGLLDRVDSHMAAFVLIALIAALLPTFLPL